jgi:hypothetical protein
MLKYKVIFRECWKDYYITDSADVKSMLSNIKSILDNSVFEKRIILMYNKSWLSFNLNSQNDFEKLENVLTG